MPYDRIVISSGHSKKCRGASCLPEGLDEVDEARKVVEKLAGELIQRGVEVVTFHDDVSTEQQQCLDRIVDFHNSQSRQLDISVHFNAFEYTTGGTEVLYYSQSSLAQDVSDAIASCGFINRGGKKNTGLAFLNGCNEPAILIEVCFVDAMGDVEIYEEQFDNICAEIARTLSGIEEGETPDRPPLQRPSRPEPLFEATGKCSHFGGPDDSGMTPNEPLAFIYVIGDKPEVFLPGKELDDQALGHDLNPHVHFIACRWDYDVTPRDMLKENVALVRNAATGLALTAFPADWGPNANTDRVADLSPGLMQDLGLTTDDEVEVIFPWEP